MSCWWELNFSVLGPEEQIENLLKALPGTGNNDDDAIFDHFGVEFESSGFVVINASRNYYGLVAMEDAITAYPDLSFQGHAYCSLALDRSFLFEGRAGNITVQEKFTEKTWADDDPVIQIAAGERELARLDQKIDHLELSRQSCREYLETWRRRQITEQLSAAADLHQPDCRTAPGDTADVGK